MKNKNNEAKEFPNDFEVTYFLKNRSGKME